MAKQTVLVDDLDGTTADETVSFAIDGTTYEIDLSKANAESLREAFAKYIGTGRKAGAQTFSGRRASTPTGGARTGVARVDREQTRAIRDWARSKGIDVSDRGRIPGNIVEKYNAAS